LLLKRAVPKAASVRVHTELNAGVKRGGVRDWKVKEGVPPPSSEHALGNGMDGPSVKKALSEVGENLLRGKRDLGRGRKR